MYIHVRLTLYLQSNNLSTPLNIEYHIFWGGWLTVCYSVANGKQNF